MTITFPRPLIDNQHMSECWIDLVDNVAFSASGNGTFINFSQVNDPSWKGTFVTGILERSQRAIWSAWRKSLRGGLNAFLAYDVRFSTPQAYPNAKASTDIGVHWDGTAGVTTIGDSGSLVLNTLPPGYIFTIGDRVGLEQDAHFGYYEVLEDVTADAEGNATITVAPFLHTSTFAAGSALCRLFRPLCQFLIDQSTWTEQGTVENTPISFNGLQRL